MSHPLTMSRPEASSPTIWETARLRALSINRYSLILAIALIGLLFLILAFPLRIWSDQGIYIDTGRRIAQGQLPYLDFYDPNLPTIYYLNVPSYLLSGQSRINPITGFELFVWGLVVFACISISAIL